MGMTLAKGFTEKYMSLLADIESKTTKKIAEGYTMQMDVRELQKCVNDIWENEKSSELFRREPVLEPQRVKQRSSPTLTGWVDGADETEPLIDKRQKRLQDRLNQNTRDTPRRSKGGYTLLDDGSDIDTL